MSGSIEYTYCVVPASFDITGAPTGIDDAPVRLIEGPDELAAVVSTLDRTVYDPALIETAINDLDWLKA